MFFQNIYSFRRKYYSCIIKLILAVSFIYPPSPPPKKKKRKATHVALEKIQVLSYDQIPLPEITSAKTMTPVLYLPEKKTND